MNRTRSPLTRNRVFRRSVRPSRSRFSTLLPAISGSPLFLPLLHFLQPKQPFSLPNSTWLLLHSPLWFVSALLIFFEDDHYNSQYATTERHHIWSFNHNFLVKIPFSATLAHRSHASRLCWFVQIRSWHIECRDCEWRDEDATGQAEGAVWASHRWVGDQIRIKIMIFPIFENVQIRANFSNDPFWLFSWKMASSKSTRALWTII